MKKLIVFFMLVSLSVFAKPYTNPATGLIFPDKLAGLDRGKVTKFEKKHPGLGVSIGFNAPGITVTIYIYNLKYKKIPADLKSKIFQQHFAQVIGDVKHYGQKGKYRYLEEVSQGEIFLDEKTKKGAKSLVASFSYTQSGKNRLSKLYLMGYRNNFLKIRFTYNTKVKAEAKQVMVQFQEELGKMLGKK